MSDKNNPFVAILMGSDSDWETMKAGMQVLDDFGIVVEVRILSAHRTPLETMAYVQQAEQRGCAIFIAGAGLAAHLAGCIAAHTCKPVIGVPLVSGALHGIDALLSTVQMPAGIPVASVAIGKAGAKNAGHLAAQILALHDTNLAKKLQRTRQTMGEQVAQKDQALQQIL